MTSMNISLPDSMRAFVDEQISSGRYSTASEYVRDLIRDAERRQAISELKPLLLEGLNSGEATEWTDAEWDEIDRTLEERIAERARRTPK